jgi:hypothetical protein
MNMIFRIIWTGMGTWSMYVLVPTRFQPSDQLAIRVFLINLNNLQHAPLNFNLQISLSLFTLPPRHMIIALQSGSVLYNRRSRALSRRARAAVSFLSQHQH